MVLHSQLESLSVYFDKSLRINNLEDDIPDPEETGEEAEEGVQWFLKLRIVESVTSSHGCTNLLKEINSEIYQNLLASPSKRESWDFLCEKIAKEDYLAFVYTVVHLALFDFNEEKYRKLSLLTAQCYLLTLTVPGARACGVFDERIVRKIVKLCESVERLREMKLDRYQVVEFQVNLINLLDYLQTFLKNISLADCVLLKETIIITMKNIILFFQKNAYHSIYDYDFTKMAYSILYIMCLPSHGDITDTIKLIFSIATVLHNYGTPSSRVTIAKNGPHGENIIDFFLYLLDSYPTNTAAVLDNFIKAVVTNPDETLTPEKHSQTLDVCVRYDAAMLSKCNQSVVDFLEQTTASDDNQHRINAVDLLGRLLLTDARNNWSLFTEDVSKVPREIKVLRILFQKTIDTHNTVKLKALGGLQKAFHSGSKLTKQILNKLYEEEPPAKVQATGEGNPTSANPVEGESMSTKDQAKDEAIEGVAELKRDEVFLHLPLYMYHLLKNSTAHVRKAALSMLELLCKYDKQIVRRRQFAIEVCQLADDMNSIVKRQLIGTVNNLLVYYPDSDVLIECWTRCVLKLMKDGDPKIVEAAMESLKNVIFDNIERFENSNSNSRHLPWTILKKMLQQEFRGMLRSVVDSCINNHLLSKKTLSIIESHTMTKYCTEAWLLLSLVANKMKSSNADGIAAEFIKQVTENMNSSLTNLHLMLEVIYAWLPDFSRAATNKLYETIFRLLSIGEAAASLVNPLYEVSKALKKAANPKSEDVAWIEELNGRAFEYIFDKRDVFYKNDFLEKRLIAYYYIYSETCSDLPTPMDATMKQFCVKYLQNVANGVIVDYVDNKAVAEKMCVLIVVMTRIAIRDNDAATEVVPTYGRILAKTKHKNVANNLIVCLTDLCKKHTTLAEPTMQEVICKLRSEYNAIRYKALSCLSVLVLQDYLKMRGRLLMNILASVVDPCYTIRENAALMVLKYVEEKNRLLLQTSLFETIFAFNGYTEFQGFDLFDDMRDRMSPLQGRNKAKYRRLIYKFFVQNISEEQVLPFFGNLISLNEKLQKDTFVKNAEGVHSLCDLFYVVKLIARMKNWSKVKASGGGGGAGDPDNMNAEIETMQAAAQPSTSGRGKKKVCPMNRGIPVLEQTIAILPALYRNAEKMDKSLLPFMDDFLKELCRSFSTFVQFVQPATFWNRYRPTTTTKKKARKPKPDESSDDSDNGGGGGDSDNEGTITTMESSCVQNNLSDEDFDDL